MDETTRSSSIGPNQGKRYRSRLAAILVGVGMGAFLATQLAYAEEALATLNASQRAEGTTAGVQLTRSTSPAGIAYASTASRGPEGVVPMAAAVTPTSAGRTAGQFSVTPTGAASYNIPIWTPPGARSIEPHLALHYISGGPDGPMGPGWSLSGVSAIARCGKTWASSGGAPAGVTLSTSDELCLDGNRLRLTSGSQGVAGSTYQTEIADFSLVTAYGSQGSGPQYFVVQGKDGRYYEYGNSSDSQIFAAGASTPYLWALNKVRDRQNNNMVLSYVSGTTATLSKILYTATPGTGNAAPYEVDFNYVARTGGTSISKYVAGSAVSLTNQLDNITVLSSGATVRKYSLAYTASATTRRPLLSTVQECGGSAGSDCLRPTSINYQPGGAGWSSSSAGTGINGQYGYMPLDLNGDGIPDALYGKQSGTSTHWYAKIASLSGYGSEIDTGIVTGYPLIPGNFAGKSGTQVLARISNTWYVYSLNAAGNGFTSASTGVAATGTSVSGEVSAIDYDGDGLPDLVSYRGTSVYILPNTTTGGNVSFGAPFLIWTDPTSAGFSGPSSSNSNVSYADFNADGRGDLQVTTSRNGPQGSSVYVYYVLLSNGFSAPATAITLIPRDLGGNPASYGDWNGDGCTDLYAAGKIYISNCAGSFSSLTTTAASNSLYMLLDYDGDGQSDFLYSNAGTWYVQLSTGVGISGAVSTGLSVSSTASYFPMDVNSDGQPEFAYIDSNTSYAVSYYPHTSANAPPDLASSITDGFGIGFSPTYVPISQNNYSKGSGDTFPDEDFQGAMYVVDQYSASDGTGGTYRNQFWYYQALLNLQGRGFEGFNATRTWDSRNGIYTIDYYRRDFPYVGMEAEKDVYQPDDATLMAKTTNALSYTPLVGSDCSVRCFPFVSSTTVNRYEVGGSKNGSQVSSTVTSYTYDTYGNITQTNSVVTDTDSASPASPFAGLQWTTTITNTISNDSSSNWCLGRPSTTTTRKIVPGQAALTRTVAHTIDYTNCRATAEIIEPNDARLQMTTSFGFDACGNTNSISVVGLDPTGASLPARTTTQSYGTRCQFSEVTNNALGQITLTGYRYDLGLKSSETDPNGNAVSTTYDDFGRKASQLFPDQTTTTWSYSDCVSSSCWGLSDLRFLVTETRLDSGGNTVRSTQQFYDGMDRLRYTEGNRSLGTWTTTYTQYDSLGRKVYEYLPQSSATTGYHHYSYDLADRSTADALYDSTSSLYRTIAVAYLGQTTAITDPRQNTIYKVTDVAGKLRRVTDPSPGGATNYTYDPFGNLTTIVDATGATSTVSYNIRGAKTAEHGADTGVWSFVPDSLNETWTQTDAKGQVTSFSYDALGRLVSRLEPESTTPITWTFGTSASAHNIGKLVTVSKADGYGESYAYDGYGRPQTVVYTEDGVNYQFDYAYNAFGQIDTLTYPTSTNGVRFATKSIYDSYGFLNQVQDAGAGTVFWTLQTVNDGNLPTSELLGNSVQVNTSYTPWTNEVVGRSEGSGGSTNNLQNLSYTWDLNGNLQQRQDLIQNLNESFVMDPVNRISTVSLNGVQTLSVSYDGSGNITNKSDVGNYTYGDPAHPHAVTSAGSWSIAYDANGNMSSRAGGAISSYSYNLPNQINYNGNTAQFSYTSDHQRWKQVASYSGVPETTHYVGGMLEVLTRGSHVEYRHLISAGSSHAVFTRRSDCSTNTYYLTSDHLGSADLVLDNYGTVLARESFSAFGARRGSNWQGVPTTTDYGTFSSTSRTGFTGHEMLDSVSLVHMGGRVYDPYLGRFLSADSLVQSLGVTQSINPYSYAWNDPLRYTDPSGHSLLGDIIGAIVAIVAGFVTFGLADVALLGLGVSSFAAGVIAGAIAGFVGGFLGGIISTGSLSAALTSGLIGAFSGAAFNAVGSLANDSNWGVVGRTIAHAAVGCASGALSGGNCGRGALSAAVSEYASENTLHGNEIGNWGDAAKGIAEAALVGGVTARITGGDFVEGFSVGAAGYLYNGLGHMLVGTDAHQTLINYLQSRPDGDLWGYSNTTIDGLMGNLRPDLVYGPEDAIPGTTYQGWEVKPVGQDASAAAQLAAYIAASNGRLTIGDNALIFGSGEILRLTSTGFLGLTETEYTYYRGQNGVVTYSVEQHNVFEYVTSQYRQGKRAPLPAQQQQCGCGN